MLERKLWREIWGPTGLLLVAVTSIMAVGVANWVAMQSSYHNLSLARERYYQQCRMADFWIDLKKAPIADLARLEGLPGILKFEPRIQFATNVSLEEEVEPINGLVVSLPDEQRTTLNQVVLIAGGYFTDARDNEVLVNDHFARRHRLRPGQKIHLLLNDRREELVIVGTAISSEFAYLVGTGMIAPDPEHFGVFYLKQSFAEDAFDFSGAANQIVGKFTPEVRGRPDETLRQIESRLLSYGVFSVTPLKEQVSHSFLDGEISGLRAFATVIPAMFLVVSALVLNVLISRLAQQQRVAIGTLKALGYGDRVLFFHFLQMGLGVGLLGALGGSALGYWMSTGMTIQYRSHFEFPDLTSGFYWYTHAIGLAASLVSAIAGSLQGAWAILQLEPAQAMRPQPPPAGGSIWLERLAWLWQSLDAGWRVALRGVVRNPLRTTVGIFATATGAGLLVSGFMMIVAMFFLVDYQFEKILRSDIEVVFRDEQGADVLRELASLPGVDRVEPVLQVPCTFVHGPYRKKGVVTGISEAARLTIPRTMNGEPSRRPSYGLVLNGRVAELLHVRRGDWITIVPTKGNRQPVQAPVVEISDTFVGIAVYADIQYLNSLIEEEFAFNAAQFQVDPRAGENAKTFRKLKEMPQAQSVIGRRAMIANIQETIIANHWIFLVILVPFAGVIFFGSILNASLVSLAERAREVATLRAIGYTEWQVGGLFLRENLVIHSIGALLGLPLGYVLTMGTASLYDTDALRFPVVYEPWVWWSALGLSVLFAAAAHGVTQAMIHATDFVDVLKVKE